MKKSTKKLTVASMLCALCFVLMLIGSLIEVVDLSAAALASFAVIFAVIELGGAYPTLIWLSASVIGFLLLPNLLPAVYFSMFFGWYPIAKNYFERLPSVLCWAAKLVSIVVSVAAMYYIGEAVIGVGQQLEALTPILVGGTCAVFVIYDVALSRLISSYMRVWKYKLKIKFK